jgi:pyruvate, orthophosphate dikinase
MRLLVARQMGKARIIGWSELALDVAGRSARLAAAAVQEGDCLSINGEAGTINLGRGDILAERPAAELAEIARWRTHGA